MVQICLTLKLSSSSSRYASIIFYQPLPTAAAEPHWASRGRMAGECVPGHIEREVMARLDDRLAGVVKEFVGRFINP